VRIADHQDALASSNGWNLAIELQVGRCRLGRPSEEGEREQEGTHRATLVAWPLRSKTLTGGENGHSLEGQEAVARVEAKLDSFARRVDALEASKQEISGSMSLGDDFEDRVSS